MGPVRDQGSFLGWTFCTGRYPNGQFAWVSLTGEFSPRTWELRHAARQELKNQSRSLRNTPGK